MLWVYSHYSFLYFGDRRWTSESDVYGLTTLNKAKSREVSTNDGNITQNILIASVPASGETK